MRSTIKAFNPATGEYLGDVAVASEDEINNTIRNAKAASKDWDNLGPSGRKSFLDSLAAAIEGREEEIALVDARDAGLPFRAMLSDVRKSVDYLRYFATLSIELSGRAIELGNNSLAVTRYRPFGIAGIITAYNHPFYFSVVKSAAALAAGNAVVVKPPEQASLSSIMLSEMAEELLPRGVYNVIAGAAEAGKQIVQHPDVARISFTGGLPAGRDVLATAGKHVKVATAELGGKNAFVAFPDVDIAAAAQAVVKSLNLKTVAGQSCSSTSLLLVHSKIKNELLEAVEAQLASIAIDIPEKDGDHMGCLINRNHREAVAAYVERAVAEGARVVTGNRFLDDIFPNGAFYTPTLVSDVGADMEISREEIFGPVLGALTWDTIDEVRRAVENTGYGLTANVWSRDRSQAESLANDLPVGLAWVNADVVRLPLGVPFGGLANSGMARDHSFEELRSFAQIKTIAS